MEYLLKSSVVITLFYMCYKLFLQRDTFFELNRWYLLSGLILASCISFIVIPNYIEYTPAPINFSQFNYDILNTEPKNITEETTIDYTIILFWTYLMGVIFLTGKLILQLFSLKQIISRGKVTKHNVFKLIETEDNIPPFSFFNHIVYNPDQFNNRDLQHIINHEKIHSKQYHSVDTILIQFACILMWFNPFVWLYKKALQQNLEFIADKNAHFNSKCKKSYQTVLLKASVQNHHLTFASNFYSSLIKKRIVMLHKSKSKKWQQLKLLIVLPLVGIFIMSVNKKDIYIKSSEQNTTASKNTNAEVLEILFTKKLSNKELDRIKKDLEKKGVTFTYNVVSRNDADEITEIKTTFKSDNSSASYNVSEEKGIKPFKFTLKDKIISVGSSDRVLHEVNKAKGYTYAVKKVVNSNNVDENITIDIDTSNDNDSIFIYRKNNKKVVTPIYKEFEILIEEDGDEPIYIINGKRVKKSEFENVNSENIETVFVIKDEAAVRKYGNDAKNGAIILSTKDGKKNSVTTKTNYSYTFKNNKTPIIIVDGKIVEETDVDELSPNNIDTFEVLKDKAAIKIYGEKAKDGAIIITTNSSKGLTTNKKHEIIIEETSPYNVLVVDEAPLTKLITKNSNDSDLEQIKLFLKSKGISAKFSKVKRNSNGEITGIKIAINDNNGNKSSASFKKNKNTIPNIIVGKQNNSLIVTSEGK